MTDEWVRDACWEWASPPITDQGWDLLAARVAAAPERFWASTRQLISESGDPPTARLYGGALAALVGIGPIEDFLSHDWQSALQRIERDAPFHENLRKALWSVWQLSGVPPSVVERVHQAADQPPGTPHRF